MATSDNFDKQHRLLDRLVHGDQRSASVAALRRYFRQGGPPQDLFTGRWFDRFAGSGTRPDHVNVITAADVLALSHLGMPHLSSIAIAVLHERADEVTALLTQIPDVAMHEISRDAYEQVLGPTSPAWRLWELLKTSAGVDQWVTANKLLARKRPGLLPIYDRTVQYELGLVTGVWDCLWRWFQDDPHRVPAVQQLRTDAGAIEDISLLRCLDVVLWMRHTRGTVDGVDQG